MRIIYISNVRQILLEELVKRVSLKDNDVKAVYFVPKNKSVFLELKIYRFLYFTFMLMKTFLGFKRYNVCHIHYFARNVIWTLPLYRLLAKKVVITVWGSDYKFFSGDMSRFSKSIIKNVDLVSFTSERYRQDFLKKVNHQNTRVVIFGLSILNNIDECSPDEIVKFKRKYNINPNKFVVTCGTYGAPIQQHEILIDTLIKLPSSLKEKLVFVFPMTYGPKTYIDKIIRLLNREELTTAIITNFLEIDELAALRKATAILINALKHDQFSAAMSESIYGGALILKGCWLRYPALEKNQEILQRIWNIDKIEDTESALPNMVKQLQAQKDRASQERFKRIIYGLCSWEDNIENWLSLYE